VKVTQTNKQTKLNKTKTENTTRIMMKLRKTEILSSIDLARMIYSISLVFIVDLTIIAVGIGNYDLQELRFIATDKTNHVFEASDFSGLINLVSSLKNRTCTSK